MAETVYLKDGTTEVVFTDNGEFLECLVRDRLGEDAARFLAEYVAEIKNEVKWLDEAQQEAERAADGYHSLCNNALETLRKVRELLMEPRIDIREIQRAVTAGYYDLFRNL